MTTISEMKTLLLVFLAALAAANAATITLAWDDPNPPGFVTKWTLYKKVWSSVNSATWVKVKDIPVGQLTTTVEWVPGQVNVFSMTAWQGPIESAARAELDVQPPKMPANFEQLLILTK